MAAAKEQRQRLADFASISLLFQNGPAAASRDGLPAAGTSQHRRPFSSGDVSVKQAVIEASGLPSEGLFPGSDHARRTLEASFHAKLDGQGLSSPACLAYTQMLPVRSGTRTSHLALSTTRVAPNTEEREGDGVIFLPAKTSLTPYGGCQKSTGCRPVPGMSVSGDATRRSHLRRIMNAIIRRRNQVTPQGELHCGYLQALRTLCLHVRCSAVMLHVHAPVQLPLAGHMLFVHFPSTLPSFHFAMTTADGRAFHPAFILDHFFLVRWSDVAGSSGSSSAVERFDVSSLEGGGSHEPGDLHFPDSEAGLGPDKVQKRVLILMSDTGGGHRASAEALKATFQLEFGDKYEVSLRPVQLGWWMEHGTWFLLEESRSGILLEESAPQWDKSTKQQSAGSTK